ncbi:hypothetical protein HanXRQr2_Chr15g0722421 [Helianthus annuus]|uniref:Uncharacterized protein n=1 Tax=Helianthus annuus TaxID=4232 RepID=A0A251SCY5_HELAN|nr:hypothetical protein HanXRQr2_Chr15g0722421 [Helianthus annuus]
MSQPYPSASVNGSLTLIGKGILVNLTLYLLLLLLFLLLFLFIKSNYHHHLQITPAQHSSTPPTTAKKGIAYSTFFNTTHQSLPLNSTCSTPLKHHNSIFNHRHTTIPTTVHHHKHHQNTLQPPNTAAYFDHHYPLPPCHHLQHREPTPTMIKQNPNLQNQKP